MISRGSFSVVVNITMILTTFLLFVVSLRFVRCDGLPPDMADVFGVDLEINVYSDYPDRRVTSLVDLDYDKYRNQIALKILSIGNSEHVIIDFNSSRIFMFDNSGKGYGCTSQKCSGESEKVCRQELDGLLPQMNALDLSFSRMFSGSELLGQSSSQPATFAGTTVWENITVDKWISMYKDSTTTAHWTAKNWITPIASSKGPVPIMVQMSFVLRNNDTAKTMQQIALTAYEPREKSIEDLFQPQEGVFCPEWQSMEKFPANFKSNVFHFKTEGIREGNDRVTWSDEWYDLDNGLVRIDYQSEVENSALTKIVDYTQNIVFEIRSNGCKSRKGRDLLMGIADSPSVISLLKPLKTLNDFYGNADYTYIGKRHSTREIESFVWQGIRSDQIGETRVKALWEWYFDKHNSDYVPTRRSLKVISVDNQGPSRDSKVDVNSGDKIVHQIYGFKYSSAEEFIETFDVISCYDPKLIQHLQFEIKSTSGNDDSFRTKLVSQPQFRYKWHQLLAKEAQIPLLRIAEIKCVILNSKFYVQFKLLQPSKEIAEVQKIKEKINTGNFTVRSSEPIWSFTAVPFSVTTSIATACPATTSEPPTSTTQDSNTTATSQTTETSVTKRPPTTEKPSMGEQTRLKSKGLATGVGIGCFMFGINSGLVFAYLFRFKLLRYF